MCILFLIQVSRRGYDSFYPAESVVTTLDCFSYLKGPLSSSHCRIIEIAAADGSPWDIQAQELYDTVAVQEFGVDERTFDGDVRKLLACSQVGEWQPA